MSVGTGHARRAPMYDNLVIGVDGRDGGRDAVELARLLATSDARYTLVHVTVASAVAPENIAVELEISHPERLRQAFAAELARCGQQSAVIREHASSVGAGLEAAAERVGADLVVVGACRRRGLERLLAGDDAQTTVQRSPRAVAVAAPGHGDVHRRIRSVGVACDGEAPSAVAVAHAGLLARRLDATLIALNVVEPVIYPTTDGVVGLPPQDPNTEVEFASRRLTELLGTAVEAVYGSPGAELQRLSGRVDLLVCGSRRHGPAGRLLLGSTSAWLIRNADCPVLVAPRADDEAVRAWRHSVVTATE